jgi:drug/metabolite transporter (DMT)-like permease
VAAAGETAGISVQRWINGWTVVFIWAVFNTLLASILAGFTASGYIGGAGSAGSEGFIMYAVSATLVFLIGVVVWLGRRRQKGLRIPSRPGAALLLAVAVALAWLGLAFGVWIAIVGATAFLAAIILELYPREHP